MSIKDSVTLKSLETKYNSLDTKRNLIIKEVEENQATAAKLKKEMGQIKQQIDNLKVKSTNNIVISEHSLLRYIERVIGIDLDEISRKILNENDMKIVKTLGNCTYPKDGFKVKIQNGIVVTIIK